MNDSHRFTEAFRSIRLELDRWIDRGWRHLRNSDPWAVAGWVIGGLLVVALLLPVLATLAIAAVVVSLILGWLHEFVYLMGVADESFPGRHDKLVWIALILFLPPVGAVAFWMFRQAYWPQSKPTSGQDQEV